MQNTEICAEIDKKICKSWQVTQSNKLSCVAGISLASINRFVRGLEYKRLYTMQVPRFLTNRMKVQGKEVSKQLLAWYYTEGETFIKKLVLMDELWVLHYDLELQISGKEYFHSFSPCVKKIRAERLSQTLMLFVFWDMKGLFTKNSCYLIQQ